MTASDPIEQSHEILDCIGLYCPMPVIRAKEEIDKLAAGEILEILADDPAAEEDLKAWAKRTGNTMLKIEKIEEGKKFTILKEKQEVGNG